MKLKISFFLSLLTLLLLCLNCNSVDPPPNGEEPVLELTLDEASSIEAWIKLTTTNLQLPAKITLKQNNQIRSTINLVKADTLIYIDSLLPNTSYIFKATIQSSNCTSNELSVSTMDTTSHNFTFETFTFGGTHGSSTLYDVAIIDENNIWAVGEININDTSINGYTKYNAVHWDGSQWELKRIFFYTFCGQQHQNSYPASSVIAFSENEIWVAMKGDQIAKIENGIQTQTLCMPWIFSINKIWGSSSDDLYVVGNNGNIARYYNGVWSRIESGTTTNINDVWGIGDQLTQEQIIFCAVSFVFQSGDQKILTIKNNIVDSLTWDTGRRVHSIWTSSNSYLYTTGGGIFENKHGHWNEITEVPLYYSRNIRGDDFNNIFVCGDFGLFAHFNGTTWKTFNEFYMQGIFYALAVKNSIVIIVGFSGSEAIVIKGIKN